LTQLVKKSQCIRRRRGGRLRRRAREEGGFTIIELLIAASLGIAMTTVAFGAMHFVSINITKTDSQVHIDQAARGALANIMLELHSGCIAPKAKPIREESSEKLIRYINARNEAARTESAKEEEAHVKPYFHELKFEEASEKLVEKKWEGTTENSSTGEWSFSATPKTRILATHIQQSENTEKKKLPIFRYYKYYEPGETGYEAGMLNPNPLAEGGKLTASQAEKVAKVVVTFAVSPEEKTYNKKALEPLTLEDAAVYRLTPASTAESPAPQPCA
jgi:hypothetical protein